MGVTFILGRPRSRREDALVDRIKAVSAGDALFPVLVIVPPQATYAMECMLMDKLEAAGLMGVDVASISRVAQRIGEEVRGVSGKPIGSAGKSILIKNILDGNGELFSSFSGLRRSATLPSLLDGVITELKQLDIPAEELEALSEGGNGKFKDIAYIYRELQRLTAGCVDAEDRLAAAAKHIPEADFIKRAHVFIHGFDMYNQQTVNFITEIMRTAAHTTMTFLSAPAGAADASAYGICDENRMRFHAAANSLGLEVVTVAEDEAVSADMLHIRNNIFAHPAARAGAARDVSISRACDMREEVDGVAAQIAYLAQKRGYAFSDMAVVCGNAESYLGMVRRRFSLANIPCYTGEKRGMAQCAAADFVLGAFELSRGRLKKDTLLKHAATGFCGLSAVQCAALKNYAYENIRDGFAFLKQFEGEAEKARAVLMEPIARLRERAKKAVTAAESVRCVQAYLEEKDFRAGVERAAAEMRSAGLLEGADYTEQAYERIMRLLEQAAELPGLNSSGAALARLLGAGMAAESISIIPPAADEVLCGDIAGTYLGDVKILFVLGMNEGVIPNYTRAPDVLTEEERELILGSIAGLKHTGSVDKQKLAIVKALSRPREKLYLSYVQEGGAQPSPLIERIHSIFESVRENDMRNIAAMLQINAVDMAVADMRAAIDGAGGAENAEGRAIAAALKAPECEREIAAALSEMQRESRAVSIAGHTGIYGEFKASATRLESFFACPYKHFLNYGIRAAVPREHTVDSMDAGSYAHGVLDMAAKAVAERGKKWKELPDEEFSAIMDDCVKRAREAQPKFLLNRHNAAVLEAVERDVKVTAEMILRQCKCGELSPWVTEHSFDVEGVHGIVDRIDRAELDGKKYFAIVDYKTGARDFDINRLLMGVDMQLVIYIMAAQVLLGGEYAFAGANYMRVYGALRERQAALEPLYRMRGIMGAAADAAGALYGLAGKNSLFAVNGQVKRDGEYYSSVEKRYFPPEQLSILVNYVKSLISRAKREMLAGENAISPVFGSSGGGACEYCDYAGVCMIDEGDPRARIRRVGALSKQEALCEMSAAEQEEL